MGISEQIVAGILLVAHANGAALNVGDMRRARTKVPRQPWRASDAGATMNALLNKHLLRRFEDAQACETWTSREVQDFLRVLHPHVSPALGQIYESASDRRSGSSSPPSMPLHEHALQWGDLEEAATLAGGDAQEVLRDALCIEAVMWLSHHVPSAATDFVPSKVPMLPTAPRDRPRRMLQSASSDKIWNKYQETHSCTICHGSGTPFLPSGSDPAAPTWPPPVAPSMPFQFESDMYGWMIDKYIQPGGANMTSGQWHYDFINNRLRLDYVAHPSKYPAKLWPLAAHIRSLWLGDPIPASEEGVPTETIYGKGSERGYVYMFIKPQPFLPWICSKAAKTGLSILHPDTLSWGSNYQGRYDAHVPVNVTFSAREWVADVGEWADHYVLDYHDDYNANCTGPFELWKSIYDNKPIADTGVVDCGRGNGRARTVWKNLVAKTPDALLFTKGNPLKNQDFSSCKADTSLRHLEKRLREEWAQSEDADVRRYAAEAASVVHASLHHSLGHALQPRELLENERVVGEAEPVSAQITV